MLQDDQQQPANEKREHGREDAPLAEHLGETVKHRAWLVEFIVISVEHGQCGPCLELSRRRVVCCGIALL
jgi:hypothetical protein